MGIIQDYLIIGPELAGTYMKSDEFDAAEDWDDGYRYELINGVLIVTPPPGEGECGPNDLLRLVSPSGSRARLCFLRPLEFPPQET